MELQDNVTNSLNLQQQEEEDSAEHSTENNDGSPKDNLRSAALQKLEAAGQDTALTHVSLAFFLCLLLCIILLGFPFSYQSSSIRICRVLKQ